MIAATIINVGVEMNVIIIATKACSHCVNLSKELSDIDVEHKIIYVEDDPELCQELNIRHSPNLVVDKEVVFRYQPNENELKEFFSRAS